MVRDTDGSAFITKAEFDSLKNNFQAQIDNYNTSIDSKIDGAIAAYLAGVKVQNKIQTENLIYKINNIKSSSTDNPWKVSFSKGWTVPTTRIGNFVRFATGYTYVDGCKWDNGTKKTIGYNAMVRGTGGSTTINERTKGTVKTILAQMNYDPLCAQYYWLYNQFYQCEPTATLVMSGWNSGHNPAKIWPTNTIAASWSCTIEEQTFTHSGQAYGTDFSATTTCWFSLDSYYVGNVYTLRGPYTTGSYDTNLSLSALGNGKYVNKFAGGVAISGSVYGSTADRWQMTTPVEDENLKITDEGLDKWQGPVYDGSTVIDIASGVFPSQAASKIIGICTYYGYNREYNTYNASDVLFYEPYSITSKKVKYYTGCPICSTYDKGIAKLRLKFTAPSNTNFSFGIRSEPFANIAGLDTTGIVPLYKNEELTISQPTTFTSTSTQDLTFYMNVESGKEYWLKVIPTDANKDITVESPEEFIYITKEN